MANPTGRPRLFDDAKRRRVLRSVMEGASLADAARAVGSSERTVQREARRDGLFAWRLRLAQQVRDRRRELEREAEEVGLGGAPPVREHAARVGAAILTDTLRRRWTSDAVSRPSLPRSSD